MSKRVYDGPPNGWRLVRAFVVAPLAAPAGYGAAIGAMGLARVVFRSASVPSVRSMVDLMAMVAAIGVPVAYAAAVFGAAPVYFGLRRLNAVSSRTLWATGAVIGAVVALVMAPQLKGELFSIPFPLWAGIVLGFTSAEVFRRML